MKFVAALRAFAHGFWLALTTVYRHLFSGIEFRELLLIVGAALLGVGAWNIYPPAGFISPAAILLYVAIRGVK